MRLATLHIICVLTLAPFLQTWGQVTSPLGRFEVDYAKGCAPLTVTVSDISGGPTAQYLYDADTCVSTSPKYDPSLCPPTSNTTNTTFTYTEPGTYSLVQIVASQIPRADTIVIEVLSPQPPEFEVTLCNNYGVAVEITDIYYDQFLVDYGDGSPPTTLLEHTYAPGTLTYNVTVSGYFTNGPVNCGIASETVTPVNVLPASILSQVTVKNQGPNTGLVQLDYVLDPDPNIEYVIQTSVNGTANFVNGRPLTGDSLMIKNLNTVDSIYCFRIAAADKCTRSKTSFSNTICTTTIDVTAEEGQNRITWDTYNTPEFSSYQVIKNGAPLGARITNANTKSTIDVDVTCGEVYCYEVITEYVDGGRSSSVQRCVIGINNQPPPPVSSLTATVDGNSIVVDWPLTAPINFYRIFRSENNGPFEAIGDGTTLPYVDNNLRPQVNNYCYYVIYQNTCGQQSNASTNACAIRLKGSNLDNREYVLNWTPYSGWASGISEYLVEIMDENGVPIGPPISVSRNTSRYSDPITSNRQVSLYKITAVSNDSIPFISSSNIIKADLPLQVFVPNSFTPNNDGLNDTFTAQGLFIQEFSMEIYSRWGELMFHTTEIDDGWNGLYKGSISPEDTYAYRIQATDSKGRVVVKNGTVHLLRKD